MTLRAVAGPDRVAPNGSLVGFDGTRSSTDSGEISYLWQVIQVPEGDPRLLHYGPAHVEDGPDKLVGGFVGNAELHITGGDPVVEFWVLGGFFPMNVYSPGTAEIRKGDILIVNSGPNAGRYAIVNDPSATYRVEVDRPMPVTELAPPATDWVVKSGESTEVAFAFGTGEIDPGDVLIVGGYPRGISFVGLSARTTLTAMQYGTLQFDNLASKIIRTLGTWDDVVPPEDDYSAPGTRVKIAGSALNDGTYTVVGLGPTNQELVVAEALVAEGPTATPTVYGFGSVTLDDPVPLAGQDFGTVLVIRQVMLANRTIPYPSFVPAVQGIYIVRLYVTDPTLLPPDDRSEPDISVVSVLPANTTAGLPVDASWVWRAVGDFWDSISDKGWMESAWRTVIRTFGSLLQETWNVRAAYSLGSCQDVAMSRWIPYDAAIAEPEPEKGAMELRFVPIYSDALDPTLTYLVSLTVRNAPIATVVSVSAPGADLADALNAELESAGIEGVKARIETVKTTTHLSIRSVKFQILAGGVLFASGEANVFQSMDGVYVDEHTLYFSDPLTLTPANLSVIRRDVDRVVRKGDIITVGGTNFTVESVAEIDPETAPGLLIPGAYPIMTVSVRESLPAYLTTGIPLSIPSCFRSTQVNYRDELVVPGDVAVVTINENGVEREGIVDVHGAGEYRVALADPEMFYTGRTVRLSRVLRLFYIPVDDTDLSIPVLKTHADATDGWKEYVDYVLADRWGRRAIVFNFVNEVRDCEYGSFLRARPGFPDVKWPPDRFWAEIVYVDQRPTLSERFGRNLGLTFEQAPQRTGFSYHRALLGLWYVYFHGSKPRQIERGLSIILGAPFFEADGEIVDAQTLTPEKGYLLVRDDKFREIIRGYIYPFSLGLGENPETGEPYRVGDHVVQFDTVCDSAVYRDYISDPEFTASLIRAGFITEPEKIHCFRVGVDADALDPSDTRALEAAVDFLSAFRTTYNFPYFALVKKLLTEIDIEDEFSLKVTMFFTSYFGSRWGVPMFDREQLSGSRVHSYFDFILRGEEHYILERYMDVTRRARIWRRPAGWTEADPLPAAGVLNPATYGIKARELVESGVFGAVNATMTAGSPVVLIAAGADLNFVKAQDDFQVLAGPNTGNYGIRTVVPYPMPGGGGVITVDVQMADNDVCINWSVFKPGDMSIHWNALLADYESTRVWAVCGDPSGNPALNYLEFGAPPFWPPPPPWDGITALFGIGGSRQSSNWIGFDDLKFYLRDHLHLDMGLARTTLTQVDYGTLQFEAFTGKIVRTFGTWDNVAPPKDDYSAPGTRVVIIGSVLNDGTYTVVGLGATNQELVVVESLEDEAASGTETVYGHLGPGSLDFDSLVTPEPAGYPGPEPTSEVP